MTIWQVKNELYEMRKIARKQKERIPQTLYNEGYNAGYHKAISDILRIINQCEYLESLETKK